MVGRAGARLRLEQPASSTAATRPDAARPVPTYACSRDRTLRRSPPSLPSIPEERVKTRYPLYELAPVGVLRSKPIKRTS